MIMNNVEIVIDKLDKVHGGVISIITGTPGTGKTNSACRMCLNDKRFIRVWRGKNTCQWTILTNTDEKIVFWLQKGSEYVIIDRNKQSIINLSKFGEVREWDDEEQLVSNLDREAINVIYVKYGVKNSADKLMFIKEWNKIFWAMIERIYSAFISVYFDEIEDQAPESEPGFYMVVTDFSNLVKEFRKNDIHFTGILHKETELFWKTRNKVTWKIKHKGSKKDDGSPLYPKALTKLKLGEAYIEDTNRFDFIKFKHVGPPKKIIMKIRTLDI